MQKQCKVAIAIDAQGDEVTLQGTLHFDPKKVSISDIPGTNANPDVILGGGVPAGTKILVNTSQIKNGDLGLVFDFNGNGAYPAVKISAGVRIIAVLRFTILDGEPAAIALSWNDNVFHTHAGDDLAQHFDLLPVAGSITTGKRALRIANVIAV